MKLNVSKKKPSNSSTKPVETYLQFANPSYQETNPPPQEMTSTYISQYNPEYIAENGYYYDPIDNTWHPLPDYTHQYSALNQPDPTPVQHSPAYISQYRSEYTVENGYYYDPVDGSWHVLPDYSYQSPSLSQKIPPPQEEIPVYTSQYKPEYLVENGYYFDPIDNTWHLLPNNSQSSPHVDTQNIDNTDYQYYDQPVSHSLAESLPEAAETGVKPAEKAEEKIACVVCNLENIELILKPCLHCYHLDCFKGKCLLCNSEVQLLKASPKPKKDGCNLCGSSFNLFKCKTCSLEVCYPCLLSQKLSPCCEEILAWCDEVKSPCPGCENEYSYNQLSSISCQTHPLVCEMCQDLSLSLESCILGCPMPTNLKNLVECARCNKLSKKYIYHLKCTSNCVVCETCQWSSNLNHKSQADYICANCDSPLDNN